MSVMWWKVVLPENAKDDRRNQSSSSPHGQKFQGSATLDDSGVNSFDDDDHECFDENSRWPRRLLNVRTMTSHKWQPGNTYGGISSPLYSVLSYTWGRWRFKDRKSSVEALEVKGVPWKIPKVDPRHFTAEQFQHILKLIGNTPAQSFPNGEISPFVWVDIACIPQLKNSAVADSEIGRQARIFRGAQHGYVWLTTATPRGLKELFGKDMMDESRKPRQDLKAFCQLLADPWFGSMWTLQESFIKQTSTIVTNAGFCQLRKTGNKHLHLFEVRGLAVHYNGPASYHVQQDDSKAEEEFGLFEKMWLQSGLQGPLSASPMQVLSSAWFRTCEFELDRIYGIMQIFGDDFRVGKARVSIPSSRKHSFTLSELEDEMGHLIIERFPVISQLFLHEEAPIVGRAWRICGRSSVPRPLGYNSGSFNEELSGMVHEDLLPKTSCCLSTRTEHSVTWATFEGKLCPLEKIIACSRSPSFQPIWTNFDIYLDAGTSFENQVRPIHKANHRTAELDEIIEHFGRQNLVVLQLSSKSVLEVGKTFLLNGILLLRPGKMSLANHRNRRGWQSELATTGLQTWARVGVCQWEWYEERTEPFYSYMSTPEVNTLLGTSCNWQDEKGTWG